MSIKLKEIAPNVLSFIDYCAKEVGRHEEDTFHINTWSRFQDEDIVSPIEQLLYCALRAIQKFNFIDDADPIEVKGSYYLYGLSIQPQLKIGNYRVDFLVQFYRHIYNTGENVVKEVIVECDSQLFHDRTEKERRYEKTRDRFLAKQGYKIFHYTGKEITDSPLKIAAEIIAYVTELSIENISLDSGIE